MQHSSGRRETTAFAFCSDSAVFYSVTFHKRAGITGRAYTPNSTCLKQPAPKAHPVVPLETHPGPSSSSANVPVTVRPSRKAYSTLLSASTQTGRVTNPQAVTLGIVTEENPKPSPPSCHPREPSQSMKLLAGMRAALRRKNVMLRGLSSIQCVLLLIV